MGVINVKFLLSFCALPLRLPSYFRKVPISVPVRQPKIVSAKSHMVCEDIFYAL